MLTLKLTNTEIDLTFGILFQVRVEALQGQRDVDGQPWEELGEVRRLPVGPAQVVQRFSRAELQDEVIELARKLLLSHEQV